MSEYIVSDLPFSCTIVIPNYNQGKFIYDAIKSAVSQTYKNKEIIVVDDGSTDNSVDIIKNLIGSYPEFNNVKLLRKQNGGTASARNFGIQHASGQFIALLDADDFYYPDKVAVSIGKMCEFNGIGVAYSDYDIENTETSNIRREIKIPFNADLLLHRCIVSTNSVIARDVFKTVGMFDESIRGMEDYEFWLRVSLRYAFCHIPFSLFRYREHGGNKTLTTPSNIWVNEENKMKENFIKKYLGGR